MIKIMFFVQWISEISLHDLVVTSSSQHLITCVSLGQESRFVETYWYNNICKINGFLDSSKGEDLIVTLVQYISLDLYIKTHNNLLNNI